MQLKYPEVLSEKTQSFIYNLDSNLNDNDEVTYGNIFLRLSHVIMSYTSYIYLDYIVNIEKTIVL